MNEEILPADPSRRAARESRAGFRSAPFVEQPQVGEFHQGSDASQAVLRQYLLTRALGGAVVSTVQWSGIAILLLATACYLGGVTWLAVLIALVGIAVLVVRSMLSALGRRLSGADRLGELEPKVAKLVSRTRRGLRAELRRVGLPHAPWAPVLIALRLVRPLRRVPTVQALSRIDLAKVVPADQVDELHLILKRGPAHL